MGCDIHGFIEYSNSNDGLFELFANNVSLNRNYHLFSSLAGVRSTTDSLTLFPPKGIPDRLSQDGFHSIYVPIYKRKSPAHLATGGHVSAKEAKRLPTISDKHPSVMFKNSRGYVVDPDSHSHSWLTSQEIRKAIKYSDLFDETVPYDILAVIVAMETIEQNLKGSTSRFVFWFDN